MSDYASLHDLCMAFLHPWKFFKSRRRSQSRADPSPADGYTSMFIEEPRNDISKEIAASPSYHQHPSALISPEKTESSNDRNIVDQSSPQPLFQAELVAKGNTILSDDTSQLPSCRPGQSGNNDSESKGGCCFPWGGNKLRTVT